VNLKISPELLFKKSLKQDKLLKMKMNHNKKLLIIGMLLIATVGIFLAANFANAKAKSLIDETDACIKWGATPVINKDGRTDFPADVVSDTQRCGLCTFVSIFTRASDVIIALSGAFAVIMFVYGGVVMITAYGTESRVKWGKDILISTTVGIFIVMLAWTLVNTVIWTMFGPTTASDAYRNLTDKTLSSKGANSWSICNPDLPLSPASRALEATEERPEEPEPEPGIPGLGL